MDVNNLPPIPVLSWEDDTLTPDDIDVDEVEEIPTGASCSAGSVEPQSSQPNNMKNQNKRKRFENLKSPVWKHYTRIEDENGELTNHVTCNKCHKPFVGDPGKGSSHLGRHIAKHIKEEQENAKKTGQTTISQSSSTGEVTHFRFDPTACRQRFAEMILKSEMSYSFVENPYFTEWMQTCCQPMYRPITRNTVRGDIFKGYEPEKTELTRYFTNYPGKVSLTTDLWRSSQCIEYMCITVHYMDLKTWTLNKRIVSFIAINLPITGYEVGKLIAEECENWGVSSKVLSITCDNASYYENSFSLLATNFALNTLQKSIFRIRCCSHVLNLIVKAGMDYVKWLLDNVRYCVRYIRGSTTRRASWRSTCEQMGMPPRALLLEAETRWNTTYIMLTRALKYKKVIVRYMSTQNPIHVLPTDEEWKEMRKFREFLKPFYNSTLVFCQVYHPGSPQVLRQLAYIVNAFKIYEYVEKHKEMVESMKSKFEKYWSPLPLLFGIAALFDPRFKQKVVENMLNYVYGNESGANQIKNIVEKTKELFDVYAGMYGGDSQTTSSTPSVSGLSQVDDPLFSVLFAQCGPSQSTTTELQRYLDERPLDMSIVGGFNVLDWWKNQQDRFPVLSKMASDILSAQVSSVASEQAFSTSKRIITDYRCSLTPEAVQVTMCREDWLRGRDRVQDRHNMSKLIEDIQSITLGETDEYVEDEELEPVEP